ncbi:MAG: hypothetical protein WAV95_18045 [Azonexus sp.]
MKRILALATCLGFLSLALAGSSFADTRRGNMQTISFSGEPVLNKANLDRVKRHILATGRRCTYVTMYNNNPCLELPEFELYLNPDPGPDGHPQWNIGCDTSRGDFNTLVVQRKGVDRAYVAIEFRQEQVVSLRTQHGASTSEIEELKETLAAAVLAALAAIRDLGQTR